MDEQERSNILDVLDKVISAVKRLDVKALKDLSNRTIHDASVLQERHVITLAVLIYSLSKIYERQESYAKLKSWNNLCVTCDRGLEEAKKRLENNDYNGFDNALKKYMLELNKLDKKLKSYMADVLYRARINKASRIYEHGISLGRTAELLGISKFELMDYIGKTSIADVSGGVTIDIKKRLKVARSLFL